MIRVYLANLGKYNEGEDYGEWITLPATDKELNDLFVRIKLGEYEESGEFSFGYEEGWSYYEEYAIHDWECDFFNINEYWNVNYLNEIAEKLSTLDKQDLEMFKAIASLEDDIDKVFEILENRDFIFIEGVDDEESLGIKAVQDGLFYYRIPEELENYIDYEAIGSNLANDYEFVDGGAIYIYC